MFETIYYCLYVYEKTESELYLWNNFECTFKRNNKDFSVSIEMREYSYEELMIFEETYEIYYDDLVDILANINNLQVEFGDMSKVKVESIGNHS